MPRPATPPRHDPIGVALSGVPEEQHQWYRARTEGARATVRKTMIVALARKLLIALWRMVTTGEAPEGVALRPVT